MYTLLNKLSGKADDFSCSMMTVEQLVYTPADPEELEKKRKTEGMTVGCREYASAFVSSFMKVVDKSVDEQKRAAKIVNALRKAQVETVSTPKRVQDPNFFRYTRGPSLLTRLPPPLLRTTTYERSRA